MEASQGAEPFICHVAVAGDSQMELARHEYKNHRHFEAAS